MERTQNDRHLFFIWNTLIPLFAGAGIYLVTSPDVIFVREMHTWGWYLSSGFETIPDTSLFRCIRYYLPDGLWGYSLMFALSYLYDQEIKVLSSVVATVICFSVIIECMQILPTVPGTFDVVDIVMEIAAETLAFYLIKRTTREGMCYED